jgi:malate dehydrogenase (oxaloacetate-decarboxylating)
MKPKISSKLFGQKLLENPLFNKSTAFSLPERIRYKLLGLLPSQVETLDQQLLRTKLCFNELETAIQKHIFLRALQDRNEVLFYRFLMENIEETMPIIYTPTVGLACQQFSRIYRKSRGVYLSYTEKEHIETILKNVKRNHEIKVIVMTDGERILGLGDQGLGGLGIPIGKLSLYTLCGGIYPGYTLPIVIDIGTNNQNLIDDPTYLGWRHPRLTGAKYHDFIELCIHNIKKVFPNVLLQFEDFAQNNAHQLLATYQNQICCFNDDIQGTAAVAAASILAAIFRLDGKLADQKICILGAGSAGCGIADLLVKILISQGIPPQKAYQNFYLLDINGLLHNKMKDLKDFQKKFCQDYSVIQTLFPEQGLITLHKVVEVIQPQILVGVSGQKGAFSEVIVRKMALYNRNPIIFPLSNPNDKAEATPEDILEWTQGRAIIATGSPFPYTEYRGEARIIAQCNNSYIFPAMGLAILAAKIQRVDNCLFEAAALELAKISTNYQTTPNSSLLPPLTKIREVSQAIAKAVILKAYETGLASGKKDPEKIIKPHFWHPTY